MPIGIQPIRPSDRALVEAMLTQAWGSRLSVSRGRLLDAGALAGFIARVGGEACGLVTYAFFDDARECEIVTLSASRQNIGVGSALVEAVERVAREHGCARVCLITTNDNVHAIRWYQRRGFVIAIVRVNAIAAARKLKPQIPLVGNDGIPIRDEIEFELRLNDAG